MYVSHATRIVLTYRIWTYNACIEYPLSTTILVSSGIETIIVSSQLYMQHASNDCIIIVVVGGETMIVSSQLYM